jgi:hypothetical protein
LVGLWTKAFFIPIVGAAVLILFLYGKTRSAVSLFLISMAGWLWYASTFVHTGSITGLPETVLAHTSVPSSLDALRKLDWRNMLVVMRSSHIWIGNGSLLGVRSWMYQSITWFFVLTLVGLIRQKRMTAQRTIGPLVLGYAAFGVALIYIGTQVFQQTGMSVIQGWYLTLFIPVEAVLFVAGAQGWSPKNWRWIVRVLIAFLFALLVYSSLFVALPYYAGLVKHGSTYHFALRDFSLITERLLRFCR